MNSIKIERLDHFGIVAGVIKDLKLIEMIDKRIPKDDQENISTGEAIAGMIINGLGFTQRPVSLTPQFFENKPLELLFRDGVEASHFNRFKLGRSLDAVFDYGTDTLFAELAFSVCAAEKIDQRFNHLDTTSFSLTGQYLPDTDEQAVHITYGYSKDHRSDLKQVVLETMVSQDGGVPLICKCWDGNSSDNKIFKQRTAELIHQFQAGEMPRYLIMDSKGYTEDNASNLKHIPFITRIPGTLSTEKQIIAQALQWEEWIGINEDYRYQSFELGHYQIDQRWIVVYSQSAFERAGKTLHKQVKKEHQRIEKQIFHLQAKRFSSKKKAQQALEKLCNSWKYNEVDTLSFKKHIHYAKRGRPTPETPIKEIQWQIEVCFKFNETLLIRAQHHKACFVLGTCIPKNQLKDEDVFWAYKHQSQVERGFRFLKEPVFFVSSLFLEKSSRIEGLLMVMTLALLVYSIAQRRMRNELKRTGQTLPNQIRQPIQNPTLKWVFQMLEGIDYVKMKIQGKTQIVIHGIDELRQKILQLFGKTVCQIYQISPA